MATPQFGYYDDGRYSAQPAYSAVYNQRPATVAPGPGHHSGLRKLPPALNGAPSSNSHIRSSIASYPASYTTAYPSTIAYGYVSDPRLSALSPQLMANDPRAVSPYGRSNGHAHVSPPTPPPISPVGSDEPAVKKKRKREEAAQLRVLNETYARTAFPSTEERLALAKALDMSPRSVQIWFQNKRQSMRQTNPQSSGTHQSFSLSPDDNIIDDMDYEGSPNSTVDKHESASCGGAIFSGSQNFTISGGTFTSITNNYSTALHVPSGHELPTPAPSAEGEEVQLPGLQDEISTVSGTFKVLMNFQLVLILFLALSSLYDHVGMSDYPAL